MSSDESIEYYAFMRLADNDLLTASRSLKSIRRLKNPDTISAVIRDALIAYARPFTGNRGVIKKRNLRLEEVLVPTELLASHKKIMDIRDQLIAHTDLSFRKPTVDDSECHPNKLYSISYQSFGNNELIKLTKELRVLVKEVGLKLWQEIQNYE